MIIDLEDVGFDAGGHLLVKHGLAGLEAGQRLGVAGSHRDLALHVRAWCRAQGHEFSLPEESESGVVGWVLPGSASGARWRGAVQSGSPDWTAPHAVVDHPAAGWGLAARGAWVEAGTPEFEFALADKDDVWADSAARLYAQASASQWDPATAIPWNEPAELAPELAQAVTQLMTYLIENENAALLVPARFLAQIHPHFREVMQLLAIQVADEARHVEVFTRRALLNGGQLGLSTAGGQASLQTLLKEPDFALASFLLSVLGEGTFLSLLAFIQQHAPDPITRKVAQLVGQDEARHVAFGLAHLQRHVQIDPALKGKLAAAVERRHAALQSTAGLNDEVFDALILLAAGSFAPAAIRQGWLAVQGLQDEMNESRQRRLARLGFSPGEAAVLSSLHTRNFM